MVMTCYAEEGTPLHAIYNSLTGYVTSLSPRSLPCPSPTGYITSLSPCSLPCPSHQTLRFLAALIFFFTVALLYVKHSAPVAGNSVEITPGSTCDVTPFVGNWSVVANATHTSHQPPPSMPRHPRTSPHPTFTLPHSHHRYQPHQCHAQRVGVVV